MIHEGAYQAYAEECSAVATLNSLRLSRGADPITRSRIAGTSRRFRCEVSGPSYW